MDLPLCESGRYVGVEKRRAPNRTLGDTEYTETVWQRAMEAVPGTPTAGTPSKKEAKKQHIRRQSVVADWLLDVRS